MSSRLGLVLYELVSGRHPFRRAHAPDFQTIRATQFADPPSLREIVPDLPVELESLLPRGPGKTALGPFCLRRRCARGACAPR